MKKYIFAALLICVSAFTFAAGNKEARRSNGKITVTTTIFPLYDFTRAIAGDKINLGMLLPPGAESHSFEPSPRDIISVQNSDVFIYIGGESEAWVDRILDSMDTSKTKIIKLMDDVDIVEEEIVEGMQEEDEDEDDGGEVEIEYDEHIWTSPKNAVRMVNAISAGLCEKDSANAPYYRENAEFYTAELNKLDAEFQAIVNDAKRKTLVFGDRFPFRYFADAYGLSYFAAFPGCSTETEPSAATVAFLIDKIKAENIPVVFHIELSNERMADVIAEETGAKKRLFHAAHNISKRDFDRGATYLEIMTDNLDALREALQ
ncbi:MAG: metal ABC transporter substrate-binding protein [Spirochaetaceae bacterium]|jgi:zinc transport system substrate-binding protein|nr:metal ABC transporter substrate-binding protein [Spirochaetaceae bacterium]